MASKKHWGVAIGIVLSLILSSVAFGALGDHTMGRGAKGPEVKELQTRLAQLGYVVGPLDGKFGPKTDQAVRRFQQEHGLKVDGVAGAQTIKELKRLTGESTNATGQPVGYKNVDTNLLAKLVSAEARGEPYVGQVAVAAVVLNRIKDAAFPKSVAGVIYQPGAFSSVNDGQINMQPTSTAVRAAQEAASGVDPSHGAVFFFNPAKTSNQYIWSRPQILKIGNHIFTR
ncbi:MAG: spore cortex-lytic enzyme [Desulfitobacteriaceae bacterium]|nr:spore cortex-lytic enzyme [Desulfitobacteriaceae bacterium]MDI6913625.1 spore cortex-lytic enzyme [Desulfitobacteriaceae bacterium]